MKQEFLSGKKTFIVADSGATSNDRRVNNPFVYIAFASQKIFQMPLEQVA